MHCEALGFLCTRFVPARRFCDGSGASVLRCFLSQRESAEAAVSGCGGRGSCDQRADFRDTASGMGVAGSVPCDVRPVPVAGSVRRAAIGDGGGTGWFRVPRAGRRLLRGRNAPVPATLAFGSLSRRTLPTWVATREWRGDGNRGDAWMVGKALGARFGSTARNGRPVFGGTRICQGACAARTTDLPGRVARSLAGSRGVGCDPAGSRRVGFPPARPTPHLLSPCRIADN